MKMISGEKVRFDQNVPEKNIVTLPDRNERFKLEWQQVKMGGQVQSGRSCSPNCTI